MLENGLLAIICILAVRSQKEATAIRDRILSKIGYDSQRKAMEGLNIMESLGLIQDDVFTIPGESDIVYVNPGSFASCYIDKLADFGVKLLALDSETALLDSAAFSLAILKASEAGKQLLSVDSHMMLDECFFEMFGSTKLVMGRTSYTTKDDDEKSFRSCILLLCFSVMLFLGTGISLGYFITKK